MYFNTLLSSAILLFLCTLLAVQAHADEVILDDLIVDGSLCVGAECTPTEFPIEATSFDTIRLKEDDPIIHFQDTSSSASFPTVDWNMGVRDDNSQPSVFFIRDLDGDGDVLQLGSSTSGGVAIGFGSILEAGVVSVGSAGNERRIINVADGTAATDAVSLGQLQDFQTTSEAGFVGEISALDADLDALDVRMDELNSRLFDVLNQLNNL